MVPWLAGRRKSSVPWDGLYGILWQRLLSRYQNIKYLSIPSVP